MNIKTLHAPTIHEALLEARRRFGDGVVLLESFPPEGREPARIRIMADEPRPPVHAAAPAMAAAAPTASGFGYAALPGAAPPADAAGLPERLESPAAVAAPAPPTAAQQAGARPPAPEPPGGPPAARPRGRLFTTDGAASPAAPAAALEQLMTAQLRLLHDRLDQIERQSASALIGASQRFAAHPLFAALLGQGLLPATATRLFDTVAAQGYGPDSDEETLRWALARALRRLLDVAAPKHSTGTLTLIGPSGAGKTSLALKLATHTGFYGRRRTTVLVVQPEDEHETSYHNPVELYRRFGLPVQCVQRAEEVRSALARAERFDQILIDTPSLPVPAPAAHRMLRRLQHLLDPVMPLQVHFVLNATRALEAFDLPYLQGLPLRPDAVALTHLDETLGWGRVAEWMLKLQRPIQFASNSPRVPAGVLAFSPAWFVEELVNLL